MHVAQRTLVTVFTLSINGIILINYKLDMINGIVQVSKFASA